LPDWLTSEEEADLLTHIRCLPFSDVRMHGVVAKRRVVHFGWDYDYESWRIRSTEPVPEWLLPLRERAAALIAVPSLLFEEVFVSRYDPGAAIGWQRDSHVRADGERRVFARELSTVFSALSWSTARNALGAIGTPFCVCFG